MAETVRSGELSKRRIPCVEADYTDVWKIPARVLDDSKQHTVVVDLVEPGQESAPTEAWGRKVEERIFNDDIPNIRVTVWEGVPFDKI